MIPLLTLFFFFLALGAQATKLRIIGGDVARQAQFPYAAAIYKTTASGTFFCGGTLIDNRWILTAGACVSNATSFVIRIGSDSLTREDPNAQTLLTNSSFLHPDYNPETLENDIGLIQLQVPLNITDYIRPVTAITDTSDDGGTSVVSLGWGQISDEQPGLVDELHFVSLETISNEECKSTYGDQITDHMVCVNGTLYKGICKGDLGAPLIRYGGSSLIYQVGVATFFSSNGCNSTDPSGFTRTGPYVDWIANVTSSNNQTLDFVS